MRKSRRGFTLVELLVVISIIGMLSSIVMASLNTAREKARDAKRTADFHQFDLALAQYYIANGRYPVDPFNSPAGTGQGYNLDFEAIATTLKNAGYLSSVPRDPSHPNSLYMIFDYGAGNPVGLLTVTYLEAAPPTTTGYPGTCRPWPANTNWCDGRNLSYYCICHPY